MNESKTSLLNHNRVMIAKKLSLHERMVQFASSKKAVYMLFNAGIIEPQIIDLQSQNCNHPQSQLNNQWKIVDKTEKKNANSNAKQITNKTKEEGYHFNAKYDSLLGNEKLEHYRKHSQIIHALRISMVIEGKLILHFDDGIVIRLQTVFELNQEKKDYVLIGDERKNQENREHKIIFDNISSLDVRSVCLINHLPIISTQVQNTQQCSSLYPIGSKVVATIIKVDKFTSEIFVSCILKTRKKRSKRNRNRNDRKLTLGIFSEHLQSHQSSSSNINDIQMETFQKCNNISLIDNNLQSFLNRIHSNLLFRNPNGLRMMREALNINQHSTIFYRESKMITNFVFKMKGGLNVNEIELDFRYLRIEQNFVTSRFALQYGVKLAKKSELEQAMKYYDYALRLDDKYSDAMVAKGAALVHRPTV